MEKFAAQYFYEIHEKFSRLELMNLKLSVRWLTNSAEPLIVII